MGLITKLKQRQTDLEHFDEKNQISEKQHKVWKGAFDLYQQYVMGGVSIQSSSKRIQTNVLRKVQEYEDKKKTDEAQNERVTYRQ